MRIRDGKWVWEVEVPLIKGAFVKNRAGKFLPASAKELIKGENLRRATGGSVLFTETGEDFDKYESVHVSYDSNNKPVEISFKNKVIAYTVN